MSELEAYTKALSERNKLEQAELELEKAIFSVDGASTRQLEDWVATKEERLEAAVMVAQLWLTLTRAEREELINQYQPEEQTEERELGA